MSSKGKKKKQRQQKKTPPAEKGPSDLQIMATMLGRICLVGALGVACYLAVTSLMQGSVAGCDDGGGCHEVLSSKWAYAIGLPVSIFGAVSYLVLLISDLNGRWPILHALVRWTIIGAALWFVVLQAVVVKQFCPWCCITHALAIFGCLLLWPRGKSALRASKPWLAPALSAGGVLGMILAQTLGPERPTTAGGEVVEGAGSKVDPVIQDPGLPAVSRTVSLHDGKFSIDVDEFPAIGDAKLAKHVVVGLFDFTCPHCRHLNEILTDVQKQFPKDLAVLQLPGHFNSKGEGIQKQMLAIWREDRETYHALAEMLHAGGIKPTAAGVAVAIEGMIEAATHQEWMRRHGEWSTQALAQTQEIRTLNKIITKSGRFPQLIVGDYVEAGSKPNAGYYYQLFNEKLGLKRTAIPQIATANTSINIGAVIAGSKQQFEVSFNNPGQYPVNIERIQTAAGMRLAGQSPKVLAPGAKVQVPIIASVPAQAGLVKGTVTVLSDAEPANLEVVVTATIVQPYKIEFSQAEAPSTNDKKVASLFLDLGIVEEKPLAGTAIIRFDQPVKLGPPTSNNPKEFVPSLKELEPNKVFELSVQGTPSKTRKGLHQASITLPLIAINPKSTWPTKISVPVRCRVGALNAGPGVRMKKLPPAQKRSSSGARNSKVLSSTTVKGNSLPKP
jgi:uncharacterized membrane protein